MATDNDSDLEGQSNSVYGRTDEISAISGFLDAIEQGPRTLVLTGEAGIGKTTLLAAGVEDATARSYTVLSSAPAAAEVRLGYAGLTDMLANVEQSLFDELPVPQRHALEAASLRISPYPQPDPRAVAVGFLSALELLARDAPLLVAIDDWQWLDESTAAVVRFAARRVGGRIGLLVSLRESKASSQSPLTIGDPRRLRHLRLGPLGLVSLHRLVRERTGKSFARPLMDRVNAVAAGNPFYALELSRVVGDGSRGAFAFPRSLSQLVNDRIVRVEPDVRDVLLIVAAMSDPHVATVLAVVGGDDGRDGLAALGRAELDGILEIRSGRIRFMHPLLANAVYAAATVEQKRSTHRRLATVVRGEEQARHLALAAMGPDSDVVSALDEASADAVARGAPAAGAELLELAIGLGADDPVRQIRAAECHCQAGNVIRASALAEAAIALLPWGRDRAEALAMLGTVHYKSYNLSEAVNVLRQAEDEAGDDPGLIIGLELDLAFVLTNLGRVSEAAPYARSAAVHAETHGDEGALAQALGAVVMADLVAGHGVDEEALARAVRLEDRSRRGRPHSQPATIAGLCRLFTGRFEEARAALRAARDSCVEYGEESDVPLLTFWTVLLECWTGNVPAARAAADDVVERAAMLGGPVHQAMGLAAQAVVGALAGDAGTARFARESLEMFDTAGLQSWAAWPLAALCALDVSMENYEAVAATAGPVAVMLLESMGLLEPTIVPLIPDVAEALIALGRVAEAEPLVTLIETRGRDLDRAWAIAVGARGRALLLAAQGDTRSAIDAADRSLLEYKRVDTPLDKARTLLVKGQLHRRAKEKRLAQDCLTEALAIFDAVGSRHWAARARRELGRVNIRPAAPAELTATEWRIAELAAGGMTNKQVAAAAFVSAKTVETNLARVYRKLGVSSRAELGARMARSDGPPAAQM
ncbi:MAG: LuxR family transcriptional regulator [Acidimicrobiales bacterium]